MIQRGIFLALKLKVIKTKSIEKFRRTRSFIFFLRKNERRIVAGKKSFTEPRVLLVLIVATSYFRERIFFSAVQ